MSHFPTNTEETFFADDVAVELNSKCMVEFELRNIAIKGDTVPKIHFI